MVADGSTMRPKTMFFFLTKYPEVVEHSIVHKVAWAHTHDPHTQPLRYPRMKYKEYS